MTSGPGLPAPPGATLFGWSRSRFFGPTPSLNILFLQDPEHEHELEIDLEFRENEGFYFREISQNSK